MRDGLVEDQRGRLVGGVERDDLGVDATLDERVAQGVGVLLLGELAELVRLGLVDHHEVLAVVEDVQSGGERGLPLARVHVADHDAHDAPRQTAADRPPARCLGYSSAG